MCTRAEIQEMLDKQKSDLEEYVLAFFTEQMKQIRLHDKMSPETAARFAKIEDIIGEIVEQNRKMQPILEGLHDTFVGGKILGKVSSVIVKFLIFVTAVAGSILWLKDWLKK